MTTTNQSLQHLASSRIHTRPITLDAVFAERKGSFLNEFTLFLAHFNEIPNFIHEIKIEGKKARKWFLDKYGHEIKDVHFNKRYFNEIRQPDYDDVFYFLFEDLMVNFDTSASIVRFLFRKTDMAKIESIRKGIHRFKEKWSKTNTKISLITSFGHGFQTQTMTFPRLKLDITHNYNDDFIPVHQTILKRLSQKNNKGLVLLHGKPGTGKTSYIRHLLSLVRKNVIFVPPNMAGIITQPDLITILIENPNSILVIEDAENIIIDRELNGSSPVSNLLNIADGLLSDCLNIQIICSFNTNLDKVDRALLRKGRLIAKYAFEELETVKARELSKRLGFHTSINSPMTLSAIYNQHETEYRSPSKTSIGFKTAV